MSKFLLTLWGDEAQWADATPEQMAEDMKGWEAYSEALGERMVAGEGLDPSSTAKTIKFDNGPGLVTDGPFAETKEQIGGFYVIEVADEAEAIEWAKKLPLQGTGSVEVRAVMDYEAIGGSDPAAAGATA
jgi:hypothetical protein